MIWIYILCIHIASVACAAEGAAAGLPDGALAAAGGGAGQQEIVSAGTKRGRTEHDDTSATVQRSQRRTQAQDALTSGQSRKVVFAPELERVRHIPHRLEMLAAERAERERAESMHVLLDAFSDGSDTSLSTPSASSATSSASSFDDEEDDDALRIPQYTSYEKSTHDSLKDSFLNSIMEQGIEFLNDWQTFRKHRGIYVQDTYARMHSGRTVTSQEYILQVSRGTLDVDEELKPFTRSVRSVFSGGLSILEKAKIVVDEQSIQMLRLLERVYHDLDSMAEQAIQSLDEAQNYFRTRAGAENPLVRALKREVQELHTHSYTFLTRLVSVLQHIDETNELVQRLRLRISKPRVASQTVLGERADLAAASSSSLPSSSSSMSATSSSSAPVFADASKSLNVFETSSQEQSSSIQAEGDNEEDDEDDTESLARFDMDRNEALQVLREQSARCKKLDKRHERTLQQGIESIQDIQEDLVAAGVDEAEYTSVIHDIEHFQNQMNRVFSYCIASMERAQQRLDVGVTDVLFDADDVHDKSGVARLHAALHSMQEVYRKRYGKKSTVLEEVQKHIARAVKESRACINACIQTLDRVVHEDENIGVSTLIENVLEEHE